MKKKILSTLLAASLAMSSLPMALAADGDVEIGFKVGDSTLMINGQAQTVETPYVVGEGVTLVPLRVITEAFGAEVIWEGETKSITLKYPDVEILLQIDNPTAEVNGTAQTLLSAPELTPNGVTMVPLRFISETFGAEVSYDEATGGIKVIKTKTEAADTVGIIDNTYIGDDYYGWSMENFKDATSTDREFDGMSTNFEVDDNTAIAVKINIPDDDFDFEKEFQNMKSYSTGYTLTKADKNTETKTAIVQFRDSEGYADIRLYVTDKYVYQVMGVSADAEMSKKVSAIMDTFQTSYRTSDIHNLSEVNGSMRKYESEMFKYSVNIPADLYKDSSSSDNDMGFRTNHSDEYSRIAVRVFSKSAGQTLQSVVEESYARDTATLNPKLATFGQIESMTFGENTFLGYKYEIEGAYSGDESCIDVFMENGDYIYELVVDINKSRADKNTATNDVLSSFKAELLDFNETGTVLFDNDTAEGTFTEEGSNFEITLPMSYRTMASTGNSMLFMSEEHSAAVMLSATTSSDVMRLDLTAFLKEYQVPGGSVVKHPRSSSIGSHTTASMLEYVKDEDSKLAYYHKSYACKKDQTLVYITIVINELYYTDAVDKDFDKIVSSIVIGK